MNTDIVKEVGINFDKIVDKIFNKEIIAPIIIIIAALIFYKVISKVIKKSLEIKVYKIDERKQKTLISLINNIVKYCIIIVAALLILEVYQVDTKAILASLGIVGLVVGLALQDILKDFVSGLFIIFEGQYAVGDTVTIGSFRGEIVGLGLKTTKVKAFTGEVKIISNRNITEVINHSLEHSLALIDVSVSYQSDLKKVDSVLNELCLKLSEELDEIDGPVESLGINKLGESGIEFRLTVKTTPLKHFEIQRKIMREIKDAFDKNKIEIPFPQVVVHNAKRL
jgi:small conductance mechanosensitive channel